MNQTPFLKLIECMVLAVLAATPTFAVLLTAFMYPKRAEVGGLGYVFDDGNMIVLPIDPVSDRAGVEILPLNESLLVGFTVSIVFLAALNVPPTVVFPASYFQLRLENTRFD